MLRGLARCVGPPASRRCVGAARSARRRFGDGRDDKKKAPRPTGSAFDPIGGVLFGRNASLPAMVVLLCGFVFFNYQQANADKREAAELRDERSHLARIKRERAERRSAVEAPQRLRFKAKQLAYFREQRRAAAEAPGGDPAPALDARIARLEAEVAALEAESSGPGARPE